MANSLLVSIAKEVAMTIPDRIFGPENPQTGQVKGIQTFSARNFLMKCIMAICGPCFGYEMSQALSERASGSVVYIQRGSLNRYLREHQVQEGAKPQSSEERELFVRNVLHSIGRCPLNCHITSDQIRQFVSNARSRGGASLVLSPPPPSPMDTRGTGAPALADPRARSDSSESRRGPPPSPLGVPPSWARTPSPSAALVRPSIVPRTVEEVSFGYSRDSKTGFLCNEYPTPINFGGYTYTCAEAAYQAQKFPGHESEFPGLNAGQAKAWAQYLDEHGGQWRDNWREVNVDLMKQIIRAKFQSPDLRRRLIALKSAPLVLNSADCFWGRVGEKGENRLGLILGEIRDEYSSSPPAGVSPPFPALEPDVLAEPPAPSPSALSESPGPSRSPNEPTTAKQFHEWCQRNRFFSNENKGYLKDAYYRFFSKPYADCQRERRTFDLKRAKRNFLSWFQGAQHHFRHAKLEFMRGILDGVGSFDDVSPPEPIATPESSAVSEPDSPPASAPPPAPEADSPAPLRSLRRDASTARPTRKLREMPQAAVCPPFTPLTEPELMAFLQGFPDLMREGAHHGQVDMLDFIKWIHSQDNLAYGLSLEVKNVWKHQMQYVMYKIKNSDPAAQRVLLANVVEGLKECVPVAQQTVEGLYQKFVGSGGFKEGFRAFLIAQKDQAVERVLHRMYPRFKQAGYNPSVDRAFNQFPHLKNGFVRYLGSEIGLHIEGAMTDPNANYVAPISRRDEFLRLFDEEFSISKLVREFVCQVNGPSAEAWSREINNESFFKWCGENGLGEESFYQEEGAYPSYSPAPEARHTSLGAAYITEQTALAVFEKLEYIEPASAS